MLATGTATISEVANRQVAERPEAKEADASGGRFAGLMAHWIQPQAVAKPPEKAPGEGLKTGHQKASLSKPAAGAPSATPEAPPAPDEARSALEPGAPATPSSLAAPAQRSPSAPPVADDSAPSVSDPTASAKEPATSVSDPAASGDPAGVPSVPVLPAAAAGLPDPTALVPASDQALASLAAQALSVLQAGLPGGPVPSAPAPFSPGATMPKSAPATLDPILAPVPPRATPTTQAVLAEDLSRSKGKGSAPELQAAQEAPEATPPTADATADPVAAKTGLNLAATPGLQGAPAEAPAKASVVDPASGLNFKPSQVDPAATKALPFTHAMDAVPSEPAPAAATAPQHADSSAMAALTAQPRTSTLAAGATPAAPLPNTPAQPSAQASPLVTQVAGGVRWMLQGGSQEAQLQLHPDSLGQVTIHLRVEGGEVHARLWVSEASSVQAVQEGRPHLEASLKEQGLQLGSFDLQQGQRPFQEAPAPPAYPGHPVLDLLPAGQEAPLPPVAFILNSRHVELYA